jgi:hypothetical protein
MDEKGDARALELVVAEEDLARMEYLELDRGDCTIHVSAAPEDIDACEVLEGGPGSGVRICMRICVVRCRPLKCQASSGVSCSLGPGAV